MCRTTPGPVRRHHAKEKGQEWLVGTALRASYRTGLDGSSGLLEAINFAKMAAHRRTVCS
jgi:hypothetical protein